MQVVFRLRRLLFHAGGRGFPISGYLRPRETRPTAHKEVSLHRLDHVTIEPRFPGLLPVFVLGPSCHSDQHHTLSPRQVSYPAGRLLAVDPRQADVEQYQVGAHLRRRFHRLKAVVRDMGLVAGQFQQHRQ